MAEGLIHTLVVMVVGVFLLVCIATTILVAAPSSFDSHEPATDGTNNNIRRRRLLTRAEQRAAQLQTRRTLEYNLASYTDPKTVAPSSSRANNFIVESNIVAPPPSNNNQYPSIHFFIKACGKRPWFDRAVAIADSWAKDTDGKITFLFDNNNHQAVDDFAQTRPWLSVRHVEGTDDQGGYKGRDKSGDSKEAAWHAQRVKTRAVFSSFLEIPPAYRPEWVCYIDDDMLVNVDVLKIDLVEKSVSSQCSPNCVIADKHQHGKIQFSAGGWCMQYTLVLQISHLLSTNNDEQLNWSATDDLDFHQKLLQNALGVTVLDSDKWLSEVARKKKERVPFAPFKGKIAPRMAVYHWNYIWESEEDWFSFVAEQH